MRNQDLNDIFKEYYPQYKIHTKFSDPKKIKDLVLNAGFEAEKDYKILRDPKTCSINLYIKHRIREAIDKDFVTKTLKKLDIFNPGNSKYEKAMSDYFLLLPTEVANRIDKEVFDKRIEDRKKIWDELDLPLTEIEEKFIKLLVNRKKEVESLHRSEFINFYKKKYKIPLSDFNKFIINVDKIIDFINNQILTKTDFSRDFYSIFNKPCLVCLLPAFPLRSPHEVKKYMFKKYNLLNKFRSKINVLMSDKTYTIYNSKKDGFDVYINNNFNVRHQSLFLIHELGHVLSYLKNFENEIDLLEKGKYQAEVEAYEIEFKELRNLSDRLYQSRIVDFLLVFRRILFEIEIYKNPNQNLSKLYAETFNRCFKGAKQKENPLYILDDQIVLKPFNSLPHAVAAGNLISRNIR